MKTLKDYGLSIDNLELINDDGMKWFWTKEDSHKTIIFPTAKMLMDTIIEYNNKQSIDKEYMQNIADCIRELKQHLPIEKIVTFGWNLYDAYLTDEEIKLIEDIQDKYNADLNWLFMDWSEYCMFNGLHRDVFEESRIDSYIKDSKGVEGSDITNDKYERYIILDKEAPEYYWYYNDFDCWELDLEEFLYVLPDNDKEKASEEIKELYEENDSYIKKHDFSSEKPKEAHVENYVTIIKMLTLVVEEILEKFPEEVKK